MKLLVVEDDRKIKTEAIDDVLASLRHESDWAQNQQEAQGLLDSSEYDLVLMDLQIPSRPSGKDSPEFGRNLLKQIRRCKGREDLPVILMTAQHQSCVDLMMELQEIGIDGSISKPFPATGRTLAVVIEEVMGRHKKFRQSAKSNGKEQPLKPFAGGVMVFGPQRVELCGEAIASKSEKGYGYRILDLLRQKNERGQFVRLDSTQLAAKLHPAMMQNTLCKSVQSLRGRIAAVMKEQLNLECGLNDVIANGGKGYHLKDWIVVEVEEDEVCRQSTSAIKPTSIIGGIELSERQRWVLAQLAGCRKLVRRDVEREFGVSPRTAKRELGELVEARLIRFDSSGRPGYYRLT